MNNVFVSYVRDDQSSVDLLVSELRREGLHVWLDRTDIQPGQFWKDSLRDAILNGDFFIACFSEAYNSREQTYMNEELHIACEQSSNEGRNNGWLIPVQLSECEIPPIPVADGQTLRDIQWVQLYPDWNTGIWKLIQIVRPVPSELKGIDAYFRNLCKIHIQSKMDRAWSMGAFRVREIEQAWLNLLLPSRWNPTLQIIFDLFAKMKSLKHPLSERWIEPANQGLVVVVTVSPSPSPDIILAGLNDSSSSTHPYELFLMNERKALRNLANWAERDLAHWIFAIDGQEVTVDLYYHENLRLKLLTYGLYYKRIKEGNSTGPLESMYPGSILTVTEIEPIINRIMVEEAKIYRK
jgi:hypothetical protein